MENSKEMKSALKSIIFAFAVAAMVWLVPQTGVGQVLSGSITGTIVDSTGAAVVGADVSATNLATNVTTTTKANASGEYRFDNLLAGDYRITATFTGFKSTSQQATVLLSRT